MICLTDIENVYDELKKKMFESIWKEKFTLQDIFGAIFFQYPFLSVFMIGIECAEKLVVYDGKVKKETMLEENESENYFYRYEKERYEQIKNAFKNNVNVDLSNCQDIIMYCRSFGKLSLEDKLNCKIYYFALIRQDTQLDNMYLAAIEKEYYKWICQKFALIMDFPVKSKTLFASSEKDEILKKAEARFYRYTENILGIDLGMIIELSGTYYEGIPCRAKLCFCYSMAQKTGALILKEPIKFISTNIRLIRKLLQTGQGDSILLLERKDATWYVQGVYPAMSSQTQENNYFEVTFQLIRHMVWEMEINRKIVVRYECGKYKIITRNYYKNLFIETYRQLFNVKGTFEELERVFDIACHQVHGTVLIVEEDAKSESKRLVNESTGIELDNNKVLSDSLTQGVTALDGAVLVDIDGHCYGFGYILDSMKPLKGRPDRGARYNSTARYVWTRRTIGKATIAVIVSEDKTINIISTLNDLEKEHEDAIEKN